MNHPKYQPEIDGLRAIAVLSVILFHISNSLLPGGFVGVDIFFVISGYLITANIYPQIEQGTFSFKNFYDRRIKRLMPSLYVVLFFCIALSCFILLPDDLKTFNQSVKNIIVFWSNHYFARGRDYFSPLSNEMPLLHTWSLAVEEQFYFVWPIFIFLLLKIKLSQKKKMVIFVLMTLFSFLLASVLIHFKYLSWAYYSFPTRYGELLIGALLGVSTFKEKKYSSQLSLIGLALIAISFYLIDEATHFPGITSLLPCLGTVFILYSMNNPYKKILAIDPLPFIGKISYQLYLWHWPILAYCRYITGQYELTGVQVLITVALTFILSILSWKFIETPIRYSKTSFKKTLLFISIVPAILALIAMKMTPYFSFKSPLYTNANLSSYGKEICHGTLDLKKCIKGADVAPHFFVAGDSHAAHLNSFFDTLGKMQGWSALVVTSSSCSPILNFDENIISNLEERNNCKNLKEFFLKDLDTFQNIVLASRWDFQLGHGTNGEVSDPEYLDKLTKTLDLLLEKKKNVYVFSQIPMRVVSPQRAELMSKRLSLKTNTGVEETVTMSNRIIKELVSKYPNVIWIDLNASVAKLKDGLLINNTPIYMDKNHLNTFGAIELARLMDQEGLLNAFKVK